MKKKKPDPYCPLCSGRGYYEQPYHSDFMPTVRPTDCPCIIASPWRHVFDVFVLLGILSLLYLLFGPQ